MQAGVPVTISRGTAHQEREVAMIVGRQFRGERVVLSEGGFEGCSFVGCELVIDGRAVHLVDNSFVGCRWSFQGLAANTLGIVAALCHDDEGLREAVAHALGLGHAVPQAVAPAHGAAGKRLH
jgi:hypothetical protein